MEETKIARINTLAKKQKEGTMTTAEVQEQTSLRREYIDSYKRSLTSQLENTYVLDEKGNKTKVTKKKHK